MAFPLLTAAARRDAKTDPAGAVRRENKFNEAVAGLEQAVAAGQVGKKTLDDLRSALNRAFEAAWTAHVSDPFVYNGAYQNLSEAETNLRYALGLCPECHTVGSFEKRIAASKLNTPMVEAMRAVLAEVRVLADKANGLKDKVVKRQTKAQQQAAERYAAPLVESAAKAAIRTRLTEIAEGAYDALYARICRNYEADLNLYLAADLAYVAALPSRPTYYKSPYDFFVKDRKPYAQNHSAAEVVEKLIAPRRRHEKPVAQVAYKAMIAEMANAVAKDIVKVFIEKNLAKLASVIEAKGDFETATVVNDEVSKGGLEGTIVIRFKDGASFVVQNAVVWVRNSYGTEFNRFPLTFHNVRFANGAKMGQPSEKRMNEVFAKAAA